MSKPKSIDRDELKHLLLDARHEITDLRRQNEILGAKVEVMELFACVLHTRPAGRGGGAAPDVAWAIDRAIEKLDAKEE